jgi:hypothetical protein
MQRIGRLGHDCARAIRDTAGSAAALAARCRNRLRWGSFIADLPVPAASLDHLVGAQRETGWNVMTDRLCSLQIDHQLELSWLKVRGNSVALFPRVVGRVDIVDLPRPNAVDLKYGLLIEDAKMCGPWLHNCYAARRKPHSF